MAEIKIHSEICERIAELFEKGGGSQEDVSRALGIQRTQFGRILNGKMNPTLQQVCAIASHYNVRAGWSIEGEGVKEKSGSTNLEPDRHLLTQIENHANAILISLQEARSKPRVPVGPGTNVVPGSVQRAKTLDKTKRNKKQGGN